MEKNLAGTCKRTPESGLILSAISRKLSSGAFYVGSGVLSVYLQTLVQTEQARLPLLSALERRVPVGKAGMEESLFSLE